MKRGRKGQFYIIAAVVIITLIVGLTTIVNKGISSPKPNTFYDLSKNFENEIVKVVDYGIYNKYSDPSASIEEKLEDFYLNYSEYALSIDPEISISFVYGNSSSAIIGSFEEETYEQGYDLGRGNLATMTHIRKVPSTDTKSGNKISIKISEELPEYSFDLTEDESFYFVIVTKKGDETFVSLKEL